MSADFDHAAFRKSETKRDAALQRELDLSLGHYCRTAALLDVCGGSHEILVGMFAQMSDLLTLPGVEEKALALGRARLSGFVPPVEEPDDFFLVAIAQPPGPALAHVLESGQFQRVSDENAVPLLYEGLASGKALRALVSARGGTVMRYDRPVAFTYPDPTSGRGDRDAVPPVFDGGVATTEAAAKSNGDLGFGPDAKSDPKLNPLSSGEGKEETRRPRVDDPERKPHLVLRSETLPRKPGPSSSPGFEARSPLAFFPELDPAESRDPQHNHRSAGDIRRKDGVGTGAAAEPLAESRPVTTV